MAHIILSVCAPIPQAREQLFKFSGSWSMGPGLNFIWSFVNHVHLFSLCKDNTFFEYKKNFFKVQTWVPVRLSDCYSAN